MTLRWRGIFTPLITPITSDESPDHDSLARLVEFQVENGVHGLWAMGTSAEFAAFAEQERAAAIRTVVRTADGRVPVIANVSDAATRLAIRHAREAADVGANAVAATPPYYYPHSQDELLAHYRAIHEVVDLPLFIYNIPQTVRVKLDLATATTLAAEGTVAGIKDSQNDLEWFRQLCLYVRQQEIPFVAFAGTRSLIDAAVLAGADGAIPSIANAFPDLCVQAYAAAAAGNFQAATNFEAAIITMESHASYAAGGSPNAKVLGFIKTALWLSGIIDSPALTSPLRTWTAEEQDRLRQRFELLNAGSPA